MIVTINEAQYEYISDYSNSNTDWKVKLRDAFRIVKIGNRNCFVKRFTAKPSAWDLLQRLKGKPVPNMPRVYDIVSTQENNLAVYYLFLEVLEGRTLKETIQEKKPFDMKKILPDIFAGLQYIHGHNFWFGDFNEENIFCLNSGSYYLIDVDSSWPNSVNPGFDTTQPGGLPGAAQEYANAAANFYKDIMGQEKSPYKDLSGVNLNYIQLLALLAKLDFYEGQRHSEPNFNYFNKRKFASLHRHLFYKNEDYSKGVFSRAASNSLLPAMVLAMGRFVTNETSLPDDPAIDYFNADTYHIYKGGSVLLRWSVKDAVSVSIEPSIPVAPGITGSQLVAPSATSNYVLKAVSKSGKVVTSTFTVQVSVRPKPVIEYFKVDKERIKKGESVNLTWSVKHTDSLSISGLALGATSMGKRLTPTGSTTYDLIAQNVQGEKVSQSVRVRVGGGFRWSAVLAGIFLVAGFSLFLLQSLYGDKLKTGDSSFHAEDYHKAAENYGFADDLERSGLLWKTDNSKMWRLRLNFARKVNLGGELEANGKEDEARKAYKTAYDYGTNIGIDSSALSRIDDRYYSLLPPEFKILNINPKFEVVRDKREGMEIHVKFEATAMKGDSCMLVVWFYQQTGEPLKDSNGLFCSQGKARNVCAWQVFIPIYNEAIFKDLVVFIPYDELDLPHNGVHNLAFDVGLQRNREQIKTSKKTVFTLTYS